eukprot:jgi/Chlat1/5555/Chrsp369S05403
MATGCVPAVVSLVVSARQPAARAPMLPAVLREAAGLRRQGRWTDGAEPSSSSSSTTSGGRRGVDLHVHAHGGAVQEVAPAADSDAKTAKLRTLYPTSVAHAKGTLRVSEVHTLYYEVHGNPQGQPIAFLHGGPAAGCWPNHSRFFDPQHYRIVLFDQRGCGASKPRGCIEENTTWDLVADIEKLREHLSIDKWMLFGGSWGVTLALAYAETHPERVTSMVLRGICLLRQQELDWFYKQGANILFPFSWENLISVVEPEEREDLCKAFYKRLASEDEKTRNEAARAWLNWEFSLSSFASTSGAHVYAWDGSSYSWRTQGSSPSTSNTSGKQKQQGASTPEQKKPKPSDILSPTVAQALIQSHYFMNKGWLRENQLLEDIARIRHIPTIAVQGRYDFVCPVQNAHDLHRAWPEMQLRLVSNAGHSMYEPGITHELVTATDHLRDVAKASVAS